MSKRKPARTIKARSASQIRSKAAGSGQPKGRANSKQAAENSRGGPAGGRVPVRSGAVTLIAFACSRALAFYRPSIGWSKLGLAVGSRSGDAVYLHTSLRRSEPLGAQPSFH